ncbi:Panacea domain-containing protein [Breznakiellaceae bacterium SP9]
MNIEKLVQVCNYLLKKNDFRLNYTKLIKLLYLADKETLDVTNSSMTGDTYVSMPNGPVLSQLYDLIKGKYKDKEAQSLWNSRFMVDAYNLIAVTNRIPTGELSKFEVNVLDTLYQQFKDSDYNDMIQYVHSNCPEWLDPNGSSVPIEMEDILKSIGKTEQEIKWIIDEQKTFAQEDAIFASLSAL